MSASRPGAAPRESAPPDADARWQALLADAHTQPWAHDFYALMRRMNALHPHLPRTGHAQRPRQEPLRLTQPAEMDFAPAPLDRLQWHESGVPRLGVRFFGLLGPHGALPLHLSDYIRERARLHGDKAGSHFLDIFHHRALTLFYRAWAQAQPVVQADRPADDRYLAWLQSASGLGAPLHGDLGVRGDPGEGDETLHHHALAFQAGLLAPRVRHPEAVRKCISQYFDVPAAVQAHVPQWLAIADADRTLLGVATNRMAHGATRAQLGRSANLGSRVWDRQFRCRLLLGPLPLKDYLAFVPGGSWWQPLLRWMGRLAPPTLAWDVALQLSPHERPPSQLGQRNRLGITTWLAGSAAKPTLGCTLRPTSSFVARREPHASPQSTAPGATRSAPGEALAAAGTRLAHSMETPHA